MALRILLIDDEPVSLADSKNVLDSLGLDGITVISSSGVAQALDLLDRQNDVDMILCDVEMPGIDGFTAASLLGDKCTRFVYLTGHAEHLDGANDTNADAFLLKPLRAKQVIRQIEKARKAINVCKGGDELRFISNGIKRKTYPVRLSDVVYVKGNKDYIEVHANGKSHLAHQTLRGFLETCNASGRFIQIQKSVIVAKEHILEISDNMVKMGEKVSFSIGRGFADEFNAFRKSLLVEKRKTL